MILGGIGFFILLRRNLIGFSASAEYSILAGNGHVRFQDDVSY